MSIKTKFLILFLILCNLPYSNSAKAGENELKDFRIGEKSILADVDENPDVMANWTVARIKYYKYIAPKTITCKFMSEEHTLTVNYHAVNVEIDGDLSGYTNNR